MSEYIIFFFIYLLLMPVYIVFSASLYYHFLLSGRRLQDRAKFCHCVFHSMLREATYNSIITRTLPRHFHINGILNFIDQDTKIFNFLLRLKVKK
jgi:hypothetical protein